MNQTKRALNAVTPIVLNAYKTDGATVLRQFFNADEIHLLRNGIEQNLLHPSPRAKIASTKEDPGCFFEDFCNWQENEFYRRFIFESPISILAGILMESKISRLYHDHLLVKEPGTQQKTPWHQDQPYYNIEGRQNVSFWIPVDPVPRESSLEFIAGSHRGPWYTPRTFLDHQAKWFPEGSLEELPDIDKNRHSPFKDRHPPILGWELEPGDLVCFHMLTLHAAAGVGIHTRRRAFSVRFLGDDVTHAPRPWMCSPHFPGLEDELAAGAPMEHPLFPVLWDSASH